MLQIQLLEGLILLLVLFIFSIVSYKKNLLDRDGILLANMVGLLIYLFAGIAGFIAILLFFTIAEFCTKVARKQGVKHEIRTMSNIAGNSSAAVISLLLGSSAGFFGAISAAFADTLSSEIGITSKKKPVLITTLKEVETGTDGGITKKGIIAAFIGAAIIAVVHFYLNRNLIMLVGLTIAGVSGSLADSFFGAVLERKKIIGNTEVNFLGSATGAVVAVIFSFLSGIF